jgi:formate/nitrite transporter FocA (FNT family)
MFFIPLGIFVANDASIVEKAGLAAATSNLVGMTGWYNFFITNLIPVTLGNIVGGAIFVSLIYWWIYLKSPLVKVKVGEPAKAAAK